jgi:hypothetical protein
MIFWSHYLRCFSRPFFPFHYVKLKRFNGPYECYMLENYDTCISTRYCGRGQEVVHGAIGQKWRLCDGRHRAALPNAPAWDDQAIDLR